MSRGPSAGPIPMREDPTVLQESPSTRPIPKWEDQTRWMEAWTLGRSPCERIKPGFVSLYVCKCVTTGCPTLARASAGAYVVESVRLLRML